MANALLSARWQGRAGEIDEIQRFLSTKYSQELGNGCLCIYGNKATGKSEVTLNLLQNMRIPFVHVDRLAYDLKVRTQSSPLLLYSLLVTQLVSLFGKRQAGDDIDRDGDDDGDGEEEDDEEERQVCSSFPMFQSYVEKLISDQESDMPFVFLIDDADYLGPKTLLFDQFLELKTSTKRNIRLILISRELIQGRTASLCFRAYSPQLCKSILLSKEGVHNDKFQRLVDFAFRAFPNLTDLLQAAYVVRVLWRGTLQAGEEADWTNFSHLRVLQVELTRKFRSVGDSYLATKHLASKPGSIAAELDRVLEREVDRQASLLSSYGKVLLLACYLAANNPKEQDNILFGEKQQRRRNTTKRKRVIAAEREGEAATPAAVAKASKDEDLIVGNAKTFGFDRIKFLFNGLVADLWGTAPLNETSMFPVLELLCQKRFVVKLGSEALHANERFKCSIAAEFGEALARALGLELNKYMFEARTIT